MGTFTLILIFIRLFVFALGARGKETDGRTDGLHTRNAAY